MDDELNVICCKEEDLFLEVDERMELNQLIEKTGDGECNLDEFLTGDSDLPICLEADNDDWQTVFFEELSWSHSIQQGEAETTEENDADYADSEEINEVPKIKKTYKEAINALEEVSRFLEYKEHGKETLEVGSLIDSVVALKNQTAHQTTLDMFFSH